MDPNEALFTISESKEESLKKAMALLESTPPSPIARPKISTLRVIVSFLIGLTVCAGLCTAVVLISPSLNLPLWAVWLCSVAIFVVAITIFAKSIIRNTVLLYQKHATERLRRSCLFTPTCSEYMLLAVDKYGVVKGCCKGIGRMCRCHPPNGGEDRP